MSNQAFWFCSEQPRVKWFHLWKKKNAVGFSLTYFLQSLLFNGLDQTAEAVFAPQ